MRVRSERSALGSFCVDRVPVDTSCSRKAPRNPIRATDCLTGIEPRLRLSRLDIAGHAAGGREGLYMPPLDPMTPKEIQKNANHSVRHSESPDGRKVEHKTRDPCTYPVGAADAIQ